MLRYTTAALVATLALSAPVAAAEYRITITDPAELAGVAWARGEHNRGLADGEAAAATDAEFVQRVMSRAAQSWARQRAVSGIDDARDRCLSAGDCGDAEKIEPREGGSR